MSSYLVLALRTPRFDATVVEPHRDFLRHLFDGGQLRESGSFTDGTGGAYVIEAESLDAATELAHADPLHTTGASELVVREWDITLSR
ncbi:YciI family protein [Nocardia callitridis]|uniref:YciI family protein n=1 Tax=Nocardia callitridis TaxID=648753 RepID=A0ABP9K959_9NOCA